EVNDSPPMPASKALNQTMIEESWERFDKQTSVDVGLTVSAAPFSVDVNASQMRQVRASEDAYYALRNSFVPLWTLYIPNSSALPEGTFDRNFPAPYSPVHRRAYEKFFEHFGTHYIKRVWVGGKAMLAFSVAKSTAMTKDDIKAGLKASQIVGGQQSLNNARQQEKEKLQNNSQCTVFGKGGDELKLAALRSLDEAQYNAWLATIASNPQVIEFDACGIWTLLDDDAQSQAVRDAFMEATVFTPLRAVCNFNQRIHFFRGDQYITYDMDQARSGSPQLVRECWPMLQEVGFEQVDAAFVGKYLNSPTTTEDLSKKLYFFNRDSFIRIDCERRAIDPGFPQTIAEGWPGVSFSRVDAVLNVAPDALYFFCGKKYIRFNMLKNHADEGYPEITNKHWAGLTFDRVDAAVYWGNAKVYFFRGNEYVRYDMINFCVDPGYPKFLIGNYVEDWKFFD
ncbi:MAG: hemopexin repeat-containing protein, partial [Methylococcales bacterium]